MTKHPRDLSGALLGKVLKPVSSFAACLRGKDALEIGLRHLAGALDARHILLSRLPKDTGRATVVAKSSISAGPLTTLTKPFCDHLAGVDPWQLRIGACVFASQLDGPRDPMLDRWFHASGCRDLCVILLDGNRRQLDRLELHFDHVASRAVLELCGHLADALPGFYDGRAPQIIEDTISRNRNPGRVAVQRTLGPVLSESNPYGLTRSEFRMCHFVSRGIAYKALPDRLGISPHTVRTHLRNIYSKLEIGDFYELSHRLVSIEERLALENPRAMVS
ncbi:LuxR C-terminal-related transcriptional regulator [Sulfitobacter sp. D35]|uniref:helix-turn-helix transcriptional regulator n=1 Tax=Sulfitobacter sp. D35 TaxID=3083252 RepID=UPI00296FD99F|nr:LuxR C-terminal-related transcriptional regulator [Sulfitobacter sp. D35]MDW4499968.1 LuxR C-terminal-related transcriptional regulator [Sulfitobacter sp. D35]